MRIRKEAKRADTLRRTADFARVEGIAFHRAELTPHHLVQRRGIAFDIDPFDENARAARDRKGDVQRQVAVVAGDARLYPDKVQALLQRKVFHARDIVVDNGRGIGHAGAQAQHFGKRQRINLGDVADRINLADAEALTFAQREGHEKAVAFFRNGRSGVKHFEIDEPARGIEVAQQLFVQFDPVSDEGIGLDEGAQKAGLFGLQDLAQTAVGIGAVADEGQTLHFDHAAFGDLEHQIDAVFGLADDLGRHGGRNSPCHRVGFGNGGGIGLGLCRRIDAARF